MGCDIHLFIEYRKSDGPFVVFGSEFVLFRDYEMFKGLCDGFRGNNGIYPGRGLPTNVSYIVDYAYLENITSIAAHNPSWVSYDEYKAFLEAKGPPLDYVAVFEAMDVFQRNGYETRIVFWFDN